MPYIRDLMVSCIFLFLTSGEPNVHPAHQYLVVAIWTVTAPLWHHWTEWTNHNISAPLGSCVNWILTAPSWLTSTSHHMGHMGFLLHGEVLSTCMVRTEILFSLKILLSLELDTWEQTPLNLDQNQNLLIKKMHFKMLLAKFLPFCPKGQCVKHISMAFCKTGIDWYIHC